MFLIKRAYFNKIYIIKGLIIALFLSAFIYLAYFDIYYKTLNTILGLVSLYLLLKIERRVLFFTGFFTSIFWFYWIGISFQYYNLSYLAPLIVLGIGLIYGLLFYLIALYDNIIFRIVIIFSLSFIHPFGFNWYLPELMFIDSFFDTSKVSFGLILFSIYMFIKLKKFIKVFAIIPLVLSFLNNTNDTNNFNLDLDIDIPKQNVSQSKKWLKSNLPIIIQNNLSQIDNSIKNKKDLIILPETVFPLVLNTNNILMKKLEEKSMNIDIIAGALYLENNNYYNATFHFSKGNVHIAKKLVLVPFGEEIPLPQFLVNYINNTFYNGAEDYKKASKATDFNIKKNIFRNAICYEATSQRIYENLNGVKYIIATSNNAWFTPSIQAILQKLLLKYYSKKYNVTIFHSINGSENYIIRPYFSFK
ncbi:MAG: apolipoprotein N-acyltransferase [Arcobacter sp.]|nr:apolipoprotein N-acyltransferase [Arcobacter sp.]